MTKYILYEQLVRTFHVDEELCRALEEMELITSRMTTSYERVLTPVEVERIRVAHVLVQHLGVNVEGAEVILRLREKVLDLQGELETLMELLDGAIGEQTWVERLPCVVPKGLLSD